MSTNEKVKNIFLYLQSIKNMEDNIVRDINNYDKVFWENELKENEGCSIYKEADKDIWLTSAKKGSKVYNELFQLYLQIQKNSENLEIIWGHGLLVWNYNGELIKHPLFTTEMELKFEPDKGKFILKPYNNKINLEVELLEGLHVPNMDKLVKLKSDIEEDCPDPRNLDNIEEILNTVIHYLSPNLSPNGEIYKEEHGKTEVIAKSEYPVIYNAPVIILRRRDTKIWNSELKNVIEELDKGFKVPPVVKAFIEGNEIDQDEETTKKWRRTAHEIYFPLEFNEEQVQVAYKLAENYGVVLQGPPGTGKSHTIANLVCHLLAHGKRVLVTSQTDRALKVLANMLPVEIRALCISILGNDSKSLNELDESVRKITENLSSNPRELYENIVSLEKELNSCKTRQKRYYEKLKICENIENDNINYYGKFYRLTEISKWVNSNREEHGWIKDNIDENTRCPLTNKEFDRLINHLKNINLMDIKTLTKNISVLEELPDSKEFIENMKKYKNLSQNIELYKVKLQGWSLGNSTNNNYVRTLRLIEEAIYAAEEIEKNPWLKNAMDYCYSSEIVRPSLIQFVTKVNNYLHKYGVAKKLLNLHTVEVDEDLNNAKMISDFYKIYNEFEEKGRVSKFYKFMHKDIKYFFEKCRVDHKSIETFDEADIFKMYIEKNLIDEDLVTLWNENISEFGGPEIKTIDVETIVLMENGINILDNIIKWDEKFKDGIKTSIKDMNYIKELDWYKKTTYEYLKEVITSKRNMDDYDKLNAFFLSLNKLTNNVPVLSNLNKGFEVFDIDLIEKNYEEINRLIALKFDVKEINESLIKLGSVCPMLSEELLKSAGEKTIYSKYIDWEKAWKWKQLDFLLDKAHKVKIEDLEEIIEEEREREKTYIRELCAKRTWYNQILKTTEIQKRSLYAWMEAVKRIGKGTGKYTEVYRRIAQKEMEKCKEAIPAWIMPLNRVIENLKLSEDLFDVVIFDESSQSDVFAISALMRGKKAIIVGDDKQISPEAVGKNYKNIQSMMKLYLKDIPNYEWFDLQTSLYNHAQRVFPERLVLKEHFRSVPEIIEFSNNTFYSNEIIPLRYPSKYEIFNPAVKSVRVPNGYRDKSKPVNLNEAKALVDTMVKCCRDPRYSNMTMGVISLLGEAQGELIQNLLMEKLDEKEIVERKIICGDAYSFQGDERDIMFLSMVVGNNVKYISLTKDSDLRRFNVAASRARNQMWLFHSVDLNSINSECIRYKLLEYFNNYSKEKVVIASKNMFESQFHKDVYNRIKREGYSITPYVTIGKYKLDFIIEGFRNRLVIECEGDKKYDVGKWVREYERQKCLERVGWKFCKIRGSEFYRDPEETMKKVWDKIQETGIEKITAC